MARGFCVCIQVRDDTHTTIRVFLQSGSILQRSHRVAAVEPVKELDDYQPLTIVVSQSTELRSSKALHWLRDKERNFEDGTLSERPQKFHMLSPRAILALGLGQLKAQSR